MKSDNSMSGGVTGSGKAPGHLMLRPAQYDCVEIYLPKNPEFLPELYEDLRNRLKKKEDEVDLPLKGYSIYEVDGTFRGVKISLERTLVIRILFVRPESDTDEALNTKIVTLGRALASKIAATEEQIWICNYRQTVTIFSPNARRRTKNEEI